VYWEDEFDRIKRYIYKRISEMKEEIEQEINEMLGYMREPLYSETKPILEEPLHTIYETPDEYLIILDIPRANEASITVTAYNNLLEIKARLKEKIDMKKIGYRLIATELEEYRKKITLPPDADVSLLNYQYKNGRLFIRIPKEKK